jgi:hypothetical protein
VAVRQLVTSRAVTVALFLGWIYALIEMARVVNKGRVTAVVVMSLLVVGRAAAALVLMQKQD